MALKRFTPWAALVVLAAAGPALLAQDDDELRRHGIFLESLDVSLINVEVFVTRDGEPALDLTIDDFEVFDDGEKVELTNFYRVAGGRRIETEVEALQEEPPAEEAAAVIVEPSTVVVLVDHPFISPMSRKVVFDLVAQELDGLLGDGTRVMVVSKKSEVEVALPPSADRAAVTATLDSLAELATSNYATDVLRMVETVQRGRGASESQRGAPVAGASTAARTTSVLDARAAYEDARAFSQRTYVEVLRSLDVLRRFVGSLAGLPGRKAVLYVADRLPVRSGELVWRAWYERYGFEWGSELGASSVDSALADYDATAPIQALVADASANRVAFYPIGAGAGAGPNLSGAESRGLSGPSRYFARVSETNEGLRWLARGTGGQAALGRGDAAPFLEKVHQDLTHYYSLAYPSPHRGDGEAHSVEVRVKDPELEVRYLGEYRDKSGDQRMAEETLAVLVLGVGQNPLDVEVEVGDAKKGDDNLFSVPILIKVPIANLVLLPGKTAHQGNVTIQLVVRDDEGRMSDPVKIDLPLEVPHASIARALTDSAGYTARLGLRRGRQTIAIGVRDELGAVSSTVQVEVDVGGRG